MDAKTLKEQLTEQDIIRIIKSLGEGIYADEGDKLVLSTSLCHGGDSPNKLYYFKNENYFYCQTHCGYTDILSIVSNVKDFTLPQSINYIMTLLGLNDFKIGFGNDTIELIDDWSFINPYRNKMKELHKSDKVLHTIDYKTLNMFQNKKIHDWINNGIEYDVMKKYNIKYSTLKQSIIIPHFDVNGDLVGIRQRYVNEDDVNTFGKYTPFAIGKEMYNHPLSLNFYGIHVNKDAISKKRKVLLVESEKACLQSHSMFKDDNFTLALCGSAKISLNQIKLLLSLDVNEVILGLDKEFEEVGSEEYKSWMKHVRDKFVKPLHPYFNVYVIWDTKGLLGYKDSPTDKGKEVLLELMKNKIYVNEVL